MCLKPNFYGVLVCPNECVPITKIVTMNTKGFFMQYKKGYTIQV